LLNYLITGINISVNLAYSMIRDGSHYREQGADSIVSTRSGQRTDLSSASTGSASPFRLRQNYLPKPANLLIPEHSFTKDDA